MTNVAHAAPLDTVGTLAANESRFALEFASVVAGCRLADSELGPEDRRLVFRAVSRKVEVENASRDPWDNWDHGLSAREHGERIEHPWLDERLAALRDQQPAHVAREAPWPDGHRFAICLTHDIDRIAQYHVSPASLRAVMGQVATGAPPRVALARRAARWAAKFALQPVFLRFGEDPLWRYERWLEEEDQHRFRSTFYVFPTTLRRASQWDCEYRLDDRIGFRGRRMRVREMVRDIADAGWEIGVHGSYHSAFDAVMLSAERAEIEQASTRPVVSVRQHYLHYDVRATPRVQESAGLLNDSTQGFNRGIGFRAGTSFPYRCWEHESRRALDVLEIPMHVMDVGLFHPDALALDEQAATRRVLRMMERVAEAGGVITLNWHPNYLTLPSHWNTYRTILREARAMDAWGCSAGQLMAWWRGRSDRILNRSRASLPEAHARPDPVAL